MSANEIVLGLDFLFARLSADSTLASLAPGGVWRGMAPDPTVTPFIAFNMQSPGPDSLTLNAVRLMSRPLYRVLAAGPAKDTVSVVAAANQLDVVLGGVQGLRNIGVPGGYIASCYREMPWQQDEEVNAVLLTNIGGLYRLEIETI